MTQHEIEELVLELNKIGVRAYFFKPMTLGSLFVLHGMLPSRRHLLCACSPTAERAPCRLSSLESSS